MNMEASNSTARTEQVDRTPASLESAGLSEEGFKELLSTLAGGLTSLDEVRDSAATLPDTGVVNSEHRAAVQQELQMRNLSNDGSAHLVRSGNEAAVAAGVSAVTSAVPGTGAVTGGLANGTSASLMASLDAPQLPKGGVGQLATRGAEPGLESAAPAKQRSGEPGAPSAGSEAASTRQAIDDLVADATGTPAASQPVEPVDPRRNSFAGTQFDTDEDAVAGAPTGDTVAAQAANEGVEGAATDAEPTVAEGQTSDGLGDEGVEDDTPARSPGAPVGLPGAERVAGAIPSSEGFDFGTVGAERAAQAEESARMESIAASAEELAAQYPPSFFETAAVPLTNEQRQAALFHLGYEGVGAAQHFNDDVAYSAIEGADADELMCALMCCDERGQEYFGYARPGGAQAGLTALEHFARDHKAATGETLAFTRESMVESYNAFVDRFSQIGGKNKTTRQNLMNLAAGSGQSLVALVDGTFDRQAVATFASEKLDIDMNTANGSGSLLANRLGRDMRESIAASGLAADGVIGPEGRQYQFSLNVGDAKPLTLAEAMFSLPKEAIDAEAQIAEHTESTAPEGAPPATEGAGESSVASADEEVPEEPVS